LLEYILDDKGNLQAVVNFIVQDNLGRIKDDGEFVYIEDLYINPKLRRGNFIKKLTRKVMLRVPWAKYGWYKRRKYDLRNKLYTREQWLRIAK